MERTTLKPIAQVTSTTERHWVGDGFHVSTVFSPGQVDANLLSPFVMMDYAWPRTFPSTSQRRGVGEHPHRGFETVTLAYQGEIEHRDSAGGGGVIGPGDVQWMTAAAGVVHEERHSRAFGESGGVFEMVQLWVNLPAADKATEPRYQSLQAEEIATFSLGAATVRLIAGEVGGQSGPAKTFSDVTLFDLNFAKAGTSEFSLKPQTTTLAFVLAGSGHAQQQTAVRPGDLIRYDRDSDGAVRFDMEAGARVLMLNGAPLNEPVVAYGPFVMNSETEVYQAMRDYQLGKMGRLDPVR